MTPRDRQTVKRGPVPMDGLAARAVGDDEYPAFVAATETAFGTDVHAEDVALWRALTELERTIAVFDGDEIVATGAAQPLAVTVPGGDAVPMAGVTAIGVLPTHRRRGLLTGMMRWLLDDAHARGEPLAGLWASESVIYGRYGFGGATAGLRLTIDTRRADFATTVGVRGRTRMVPEGRFLEVLPPIYDRARPRTAGMLSRSPARWDWAVHDPDHLRDGASRRFAVTFEDRGYALYRIKEDEDAAGAAFELRVEELVAADDEALAGLWRYLLDVDLVVRVYADRRPVDDPLRLLLADPRQAVTRVVDNLWLRILDVPAALAARHYTTPGSLVLAVDDPFGPWAAGRFLLETGDGRARCTPTTRSPDLSLGAADLGAIYLGGTRPSTLARAGRVTAHTTGALILADALFQATPAPWSPFVF